MSTILKALRRLEEDRSLVERPPLRDEVAAAQPGVPLRRPRRRGPALVAGGLAGFGLALLAVLVIRSGTLGPAAKEAGLSGVDRSAPAPEEAAASVPTEVVASAPPFLPETRGAPTTSATAAPAAEAEGRVPEVAPTAKRAPAPEPEPVVERASGAARAGAAGDPPVPRAASGSLASQAALPDLSALPAPELHVRTTRWHPDAARRSALVEVAGRDEPLRVREGDVIGSLVLLSIEPGGIVFLRDGERVEQRVGERR